MGLMDKLKNIFFEEEEEEEIAEFKEPVEKEISIKKVEVPKRKRETLEIEIEPKQEIQEEMVIETPKEVKKPVVKPQQELIFDDEDFLFNEKPKKEVEQKPKKADNLYKTRENRDYFKTESVKEKKETPKYEYNSYKEKSETKTFTPSPIISPIYGILDKNYKKEEVRERKEVRISSRPTKMDLDSVRNKAFGDLENDLLGDTLLKEERKETKEEKKPEIKSSEIRKIYDISDNKEKPTIDKVTLGEADEYFNDLGLAYNTDYKDISKELSDGKILETKKSSKQSLEDNLFDLIESMYDRED